MNSLKNKNLHKRQINGILILLSPPQKKKCFPPFTPDISQINN